MKRLFLFALLLCACYTAAAQQQINVPITEQSEQDHTVGPRSPAIIPIKCYYYPEAGEFCLDYLFDMGIVEVTVINLTEMTEVTYHEDSSDGVIYYPIEEGLIRVSIRDHFGRMYTGCFYAYYTD